MIIKKAEETPLFSAVNCPIGYYIGTPCINNIKKGLPKKNHCDIISNNY